MSSKRTKPISEKPLGSRVAGPLMADDGLIDGVLGFVEDVATMGNAFLVQELMGDTPPESPAPPETAEGSALVVGSAENSEVAYDDSFTPALVAELNNNPNLSLEQILTDAAHNTLDVTGADQPLHHPTLAAFGDQAANQSEGTEPTRSAVFVANEAYVHHDDLGTPHNEAVSLAGALGSRGYQNAGVHDDQSATGIQSAFGSLVDNANPGDELVAFYGGHGAPEGLVGVQDGDGTTDIYGNSQVSGIVSAATQKGAHIRVIMDSCHSGSAAQAVRDERRNELAERTDGLGDLMYMEAAEVAAETKRRILTHLESRNGKPAVLEPLYAEVDAQFVALEAQYAVLDEQYPDPSDASNEAAHRRQELDKAWAKLDEQWNALVARLDELDADPAYETWKAEHDVVSSSIWTLCLPALGAATSLWGCVSLPPSLTISIPWGPRFNTSTSCKTRPFRP